MSSIINYCKTANECKQKGDYDSAIENFKNALEIDPYNLSIYNDLGIIYYCKKDYKSAIKIYEKAIEVNPSYAIAYNNLGIICYEQQNYLESINNYQKAINLNPKYYDAYHNLGNAYFKINRHDKAIEIYKKALEINPVSAHIYNNLGISYSNIGQYDLSIKNFKKVTGLQPDYIDAYYNLAEIYSKKNDQENALNYYLKTIELKPDYLDTSTKLGHLYAGRKEYKLAVDCYNHSLKFNQNLSDVDLYNNLGVCYQNIKQYELAAEAYNKAIKLNPAHIESYCNLGVTYSFLEQLEESETCYKKVIGLNPEYADAYYNLAILNTKQNMIKESIKNYEKSVKLDPNPNRIFNLSMNCLLSGNYKKGLELYEIRTKLENYKLLNIPKFDKPKWDGKSFKGKTLYIYSEQGYGDSIQFSRYIFQLKNLGGKILFKPQAGLEKLFRQSHIPAEIIDNNVKNEDINFDIHCSIVSLPYLLNARIDNVPAAKKYLYSDPETVAFYKEKYFDNNLFKIGIKWQGNAVGDINRAASLENFYKLTKLKNIKLYSLQKDFGIEQLKDKPDNIDIINLGDTFKDFADTAAAIQNLDLIVTIDTSVAHLAGAMNKPTIILIPYCPEWRWLLDREDTPWYKSAKLFRQKERNNWDEVLQRVFEELNKTIII